MTMPLYATDAEIAEAIMGPKRAKDWPSTAKYLETKHGPMPPFNEVMGGRYWPAVLKWFENFEGLANVPDAPTIAPDAGFRIAPLKPDCKEDFYGTEASTACDRRTRGRGHR